MPQKEESERAGESSGEADSPVRKRFISDNLMGGGTEEFNKRPKCVGLPSSKALSSGAGQRNEKRENKKLPQNVSRGSGEGRKGEN